MKNEAERIFRNRQEAGEQLGAYLQTRYANKNPLVIGIPRGGFEVAYYVARCLQAELSLIVAKKLPVPERQELAFGAIAEEQTQYVFARATEFLTDEEIEQITEEQSREVDRRVRLYRPNQPLPSLKDRTVLLIDDGIATGATLVPVIRLCRQKKASRIVVAVPVAGQRYDRRLHEADQLEILVQPPDFYAVGQVYESFGDCTDEEMTALLRLAGML